MIRSDLFCVSSLFRALVLCEGACVRESEIFSENTGIGADGAGCQSQLGACPFDVDV